MNAPTPDRFAKWTDDLESAEAALEGEVAAVKRVLEMRKSDPRLELIWDDFLVLCRESVDLYKD